MPEQVPSLHWLYYGIAKLAGGMIVRQDAGVDPDNVFVNDFLTDLLNIK